MPGIWWPQCSRSLYGAQVVSAYRRNQTTPWNPRTYSGAPVRSIPRAYKATFVLMLCVLCSRPLFRDLNSVSSTQVHWAGVVLLPISFTHSSTSMLFRHGCATVCHDALTSVAITWGSDSALHLYQVVSVVGPKAPRRTVHHHEMVQHPRARERGCQVRSCTKPPRLLSQGCQALDRQGKPPPLVIPEQAQAGKKGEQSVSVEHGVLTFSISPAK